MFDLSQMLEWRAELIKSRLSGVQTVTDYNGESITYKSDKAMAAAIRFADAQISLLSNQKQPKSFYVRTH